MKLDIRTLRLFNRVTDRMNEIRKNPHRYDIDAEDMDELAALTEKLEQRLLKVKVITAN